jgi:hypothetical protein
MKSSAMESITKLAIGFFEFFPISRPLPVDRLRRAATRATAFHRLEQITARTKNAICVTKNLIYRYTILK